MYGVYLCMYAMDVWVHASMVVELERSSLTMHLSHKTWHCWNGKVNIKANHAA